MFNGSKVMEEEKSPVKKDYTHEDILDLKPKNLYSSMGKMIDSNKPSASRATFGKAERKDSKKVL